MRARTPPVVASVLAAGLAALAVWRGACVLAGPDTDTDAYAHHMIARAILANPRDLAVHWVWLPLFHYLQVPLVALGGTMDPVRWANSAFAAGVPLVLFLYVRRTARGGPVWTSPDATALVAALASAACPIAMQMGTTAQPEPLFGLLVLGVAIAYQRCQYWLAAAMLGAATLLRYEAWASLAAIAAIATLSTMARWRSPGSGLPEPRSWRPWIVVAVPLVLILGWAALRRPVDGRWFGFLRDTHQFAAGAMHEKSAFERGPMGLGRDVLYYPILVPIRVMGPLMPLVPFGVARTVREQGGRFVLVLAACLAFVSLTWVMRSSLGLDRHFVVAVPLYATFAAQGLAVIADGVARLARSPAIAGASERAAVVAGRAVAGALAVASLAGMAIVLEVWMGFWRGSIQRGWPDRAALGTYLRSLPDAPTIFCDDATLEILSGVDRRRFDRHWVDDPHTWDVVADVARTRGVAYVATWSRKLVGHELDGDVVFRAGQVEADPSSGVAVMRVPDGGRTPR
jgi:hypothetical protein